MSNDGADLGNSKSKYLLHFVQMIRRLRKCKTARLHYFTVVPEKNRTQVFIFSVKSISRNFSWKWFHGKFLAINKRLIFFLLGIYSAEPRAAGQGLIPSGALRPLSKLICLNAGHFKEKYVLCSLALQILCAYFWKKYLAIFTHKYIIIFSNLEIHVEIKRGVSFGKKEY